MFEGVNADRFQFSLRLLCHYISKCVCVVSN